MVRLNLPAREVAKTHRTTELENLQEPWLRMQTSPMHVTCLRANATTVVLGVVLKPEKPSLVAVKKFLTS
jgi:hypothetical protein